VAVERPADVRRVLRFVLWGAIVATGFAGMINTGFDIMVTEMLGKNSGNFLTPFRKSRLISSAD
jgi:hypothetical protein